MIDGYEINYYGLVHQIDPQPFVYNTEYIAKSYDTYKTQCDMMSHLRYGYIRGVIGDRKPSSILDIGYGNGSFLKICESDGVNAFGADVSDYELHYGTKIEFDKIFDTHFDIITFFDSLEHFHELQFIERLKCRYVVVSVPHCAYNNIKETHGELQADEYFTNWKHRKPDEHVWHFDANSLIITFVKAGYSCLATSNIEDLIRKPTIANRDNILTAVFVKD